MKKLDKNSEKSGKKSGEIADAKLDKVAGGLSYASTSLAQPSVGAAGAPKVPLSTKIIP